jgi:abnormal spindle-like microcephaly-associated protein
MLHAWSQNVADQQDTQSHASGNLARPRRKRVSTILKERLGANDRDPAQKVYSKSSTVGSEASSKSGRTGDGKEKKSSLKKEPRRRTIYIPEDTTVFTIHPGASSTITDSTLNAAALASSQHQKRMRRERTPDCGLELVTLSEEESEPPLVPVLKKNAVGEERSKRAATPKKSRKSLAVAPKRVPLKESTRVRQSVAFADDVLGADTGKENQPPEGRGSRSSKSSMGLKEKAKRRSTILPNGYPALIRSSSTSSVPPSKASKGTERERIEMEAPRPKTKKRVPSDSSFVNKSQRSPRLRKTATASTIEKAHEQHARSLSAAEKKSANKIKPATPASTSRVPKRNDESSPVGPFTISKLSTSLPSTSATARYPFLTEDLAHPELYEDHWLEHQEITLAELLNCILVPSDSQQTEVSDSAAEHKALRRKLLSIYQDPQFPLLSKRLTASLQYGALTVTKDVVEKSLKLRDDIGVRKNFVALFLETYSLGILRAAVEVVVGRECPQTKLRLSGNLTAAERKEREHRNEKKSIAKFFDTFFVQHSDAVRPVAAGAGSIGAIARVTKHGNEEHGSYVWSWRRTVLRSLMLILLLDRYKAKTDTTACLFQASSQHKSSMAILQAFGTMLLPSLGDVVKPLRNLNYAVETVQYPLQEYEYRVGNLAADLRDGVRLTRLVELLLFGRTNDDDYPLSGHLKFPCPDRARKSHNVQVALAALAGMDGAASRLCQNVGADDIVDGHREKTLSLLWGLVSQVGLAGLLDWKQLNAEIRRLLVDSLGEKEVEEAAVNFEDMDHDTSLLLWAQSIGARRGAKVSNLTTSFADGKALEAIVDAYLPFVPGASVTISASLSSSVASAQSSLSRKLKAVGFSKSFVSLFDVNMGIPSSQSIVTTLSLLASRFLPLLAPHRAAIIIQRNVRSFLARCEVHRRVVLMRLAHHCAMVVEARERVVGAAVVIQTVWRGVLHKRFASLNRDVGKLQALARGYLIRRAVGRSRKRLRVRGGW